MTPPRAILDSDIVFSRVLHELFARLALAGGFLTLIWSDELLAEAERALIEKKQLPADRAAAWVGLLKTHFPAGRVDPASLAPAVNISELTRDPDDEHVCALALAGNVEYLFTFDRGYLHAALLDRGVRVLSPDVFLSALIDQEPESFVDILRRQRAVWTGEQRTLAELIDAFEHARCPMFAKKARELLDLD